MEGKAKAIMTALGAFFFMAFVQSLVSTVMTDLLGPEGAGARQALVTGIAAVVIIAVLLVMDRLHPGMLLKENLLKSTVGLVPLLCCLLLGFAANLTLAAGFTMLPLSESFLSDYSQAVPLGKGAAMWIELASFCLLVPAAEEMLFRGTIYDALYREFSVCAAFAGSCLIFAWGHGQLLWFLYALLMGAALMLLRIKTGSLYASIAFHMAFNGANFFPVQESWKPPVVLLAGLACCALLSVLIYCSLRKKQRPE